MSLLKYFKPTPKKTTPKSEDSVKLAIGEIVWTKLSDFPWWPCFVCKEPGSEKLFDENSVHVQFFGDPPTRDWVLKRNVKQFSSMKPHENEEDVKAAFKEACEAEKLSKEKRIEQYYADDLSESDDQETNNNDVKEDEEDDDKENTTKGGQKRSLSSKPKSRKRIKLCIESESDEEFDDETKDETFKPEEKASSEEEEMQSDDSVSSTEKKPKSVSTPKVNGSIKRKISTPNNNSFKDQTPNKKLNASISRAQSTLSKFSSPVQAPPSPSVMDSECTQYTHNRLEFLKDGKRKDKQGRLHTDSEYDSRTLLVPDWFLNDSKEVTPGLKQWWILKSKMYDTVIFFKVGKFYEFYHMDADVGVKELGLLYMKGKFAHCGFPEVAFERYSDILIQRGYKVARIEQTETPQALAARGGGKVVKREVCAIITKGTRTYGIMEAKGDESSAAYLLAFVEKPCPDGQIGESEFGVCFVDTSIGKFYLGQFVDDRQCSRFLTMISQFPPVQVLYEKKGLSPKISSILNNELLASIKEPLNPGSEFWDSAKTLKTFHKENYFADRKDDQVHWPPLLKEVLEEGDKVGLEAPISFQLAISALGACTWYLKKCCIEQELLSMCQFQKYIPPDDVTQKKKVQDNTLGQHMILDGITLTNLDIIQNADGGTEGTLLELLSFCATIFGKRYFTQWLCMPLCQKKLIDARLDAVEDLMNNNSVFNDCRSIMKQLPDLDRVLRRIHAMGSLRRSQDHPEGRAVYFNIDVFNKKKIADLLSAIEGFQKVLNIIELARKHDFKSKLINNLVQLEDEGLGFPDLKPMLHFFKMAFDHRKARETGTIHPKPGVDNDYDAAQCDIELINDKLNNYLKTQRKRLGYTNIHYWGNGKNRFQLEVPEDALRKSTPEEYHLKSQKKGYKRFYTDFIVKMIEQLTKAEERRDNALNDTLRSIFNKFDQHYLVWQKAVHLLATLDCLMSLAIYSRNISGVSCRPEIIDIVDGEGNERKPFIELRNSRHPCSALSWKGEDFIPNDILLGIDEFNIRADHRPNMGGKSTLMRQAGTILIMAQLGCYVPADVCRFTPVDRVFTRLGARDRIMHGESTFFVELSETSIIFQHATKHSLVLLDELGRGTATFDGTAIASSVVNELSTKYNCRTFFSTHYHSLVDDFTENPKVKLGHMACMVEKEDESITDPTEETITFLYKFTGGACPKSYGFNAAALAGIPKTIIKRAHEKAVQFEESTKNLKHLRSLLNAAKENKLRTDILKELCIR
ncbi:DNA mismatch repair protein Msh6-like [Clytia hemisphaerica]